MPTNPIPIAEFRRQVMAGEIAFNKSTVRTAQTVLKLVERLGAATTADMTPELLDSLAADLIGRDLAETTKNTYLASLKLACRIAVDKGMLKATPFDARPDLVRTLFRNFKTTNRGNPAGRNIRTPAEFVAVMAHLESRAAHDVHEHRLFVLCSMIAYTGIAGMDAAGLRVSDIDFEAKTLRVPHRGRRKILTPWVIPITDNLAETLATWLHERSKPIVSPTTKLRPETVSEIKRLKAEGVFLKEIARQTGAGIGAVKHILAKRSWKPRPESEYLFPRIKPKSTEAPGPWSGLDPKHYAWLQAAADAVGIRRLKIDDFRYLQRLTVVPALVTLKPHQAAPLAEVSPVLLGSPTTPPVVLGQVVGVLTAAEFDIVQTILNAYPKGLTWKQLDDLSGRKPSRVTVTRLKKKDALWDSVIKTPAENPHGDCRIIAP